MNPGRGKREASGHAVVSSAGGSTSKTLTEFHTRIDFRWVSSGSCRRIHAAPRSDTRHRSVFLVNFCSSLLGNIQNQLIMGHLSQPIACLSSSRRLARNDQS